MLLSFDSSSPSMRALRSVFEAARTSEARILVIHQIPLSRFHLLMRAIDKETCGAALGYCTVRCYEELCAPLPSSIRLTRLVTLDRVDLVDAFSRDSLSRLSIPFGPCNTMVVYVSTRQHVIEAATLYSQASAVRPATFRKITLVFVCESPSSRPAGVALLQTIAQLFPQERRALIDSGPVRCAPFPF